VLVDTLRRHRLFAPSFFGRAEDQAYILPVVTRSDLRPVYLHQSGLIMRHDKHAFAQEAIETAYVGKLLGDYIRILYFSTHARVLARDVEEIKAEVDPFTGCFISRIPTTVVYLRFALKAGGFFAQNKTERGAEFVTGGARRITKALDFVAGQESELERTYRRERTGWDLYYDALEALERGLAGGDSFAIELRERARAIAAGCTFSGD
jgi:hypothetical protein